MLLSIFAPNASEKFGITRPICRRAGAFGPGTSRPTGPGATKVPFPLMRVTAPSRTSISMAWRTVMRLTAKASQSCFSVGSRSPHRNSPLRILRSRSR